MENGHNGTNGVNGANGKDGVNSDPTALTTDQIMREVAHLRELIEARLDHTDSKFEESDKAVAAALESAQKAVVELDSSITRRLDAAREVVEAKYVTYRTLLDSNAQKVESALVAADKAVSAAFASSKEAISKADTSVEKRFDLIIKQIDELKSSRDQGFGQAQAQPTTAAQIADLASEVRALRDFKESNTGQSTGKSSILGWIFAGIGGVATILSIVIILSNVLTAKG